MVFETARSFSNKEHSNFYVRYVSQKNDYNVPARSVLVKNHSHSFPPSEFYDTETVEEKEQEQEQEQVKEEEEKNQQQQQEQHDEQE